ncbi:hypothetical protein ABIA38_009088 [Embleya sp. AB8]
MFPLGRPGRFAVTVADDHRSARGWMHGLARFMSTRGTPAPAATVRSYTQVRAARAPDDKRTVDRDITPLRTDVNLLWALRMAPPDAVHTTDTDQDGVNARIHDGTSSWAVVTTLPDGSARVEQGGPRRLFDAFETAWDAWTAHGSVGRRDHGITITEHEQYVWEGDPARPDVGRSGAAGVVPVFTVNRSTGEVPSRAPCGLATVTPQTFTVASRPTTTFGPGVPRPDTRGTGAHRCPARIRQIRAGVSGLRSVQPLVPRVHLPLSLAGPAPSGDTGPSRRCRGCFRPHRRLPARPAPGFTALLRQHGGGGLPPPLGCTAPDGARGRLPGRGCPGCGGAWRTRPGRGRFRGRCGGRSAPPRSGPGGVRAGTSTATGEGWEQVQGLVERDRPAVSGVAVHAHDPVGGNGVGERLGDRAELACRHRVRAGCVQAGVAGGRRRPGRGGVGSGGRFR